MISDKTNKIPARCQDCGGLVRPRQGLVRMSNDGTRWVVRHTGCNWQHGSSSKLTDLTYLGGPYDGRKRSPELLSGRPVVVIRASAAAEAAGMPKGLYKRDGDYMRWVELPAK